MTEELKALCQNCDDYGYTVAGDGLSSWRKICKECNARRNLNIIERIHIFLSSIFKI
jgi:hypothetical protein